MIADLMLMLPFFTILSCSSQELNSEHVESGISVTVQRIFTEQYSGIEQPLRVVIRTSDHWQSVWNEITRDRVTPAAPPVMNFSQSMVILAAMGMRATGGHELSIKGVFRKEGCLSVVVQQIVLGDGCMTTQVLTSPVDAVQVPRSDEPVVFVEEQETRDCG